MVSAHRVAGRLIEELVSADLDRQLAPEDASALEEHLRHCDECRELLVRREKLDEGLRTLSRPATSANDSDVVWAGIASQRAEPRRIPAVLGRLAFAAVVLLAAALAGIVLVGRGPAATAPPERELVATATLDLPGGGTGTLTIEQGSALARAGSQTGVGSRVELRLAQPPTHGRAEIRFSREGESAYGILGSAPDLTGSSRSTFGGAFPRPAGSEPVTYRVWLHFDADTGAADSTSIVVEVTATRRGEEARAH